jgi:ABC-type uncharacterized transport system ATPase subunit
MNNERMREIFAEELDQNGERLLARKVRSGLDITAVLAAIERVVEEALDNERSYYEDERDEE